MEVSIIVPVFNAEKTLCCCVDSILHQEYRDFELILVDDGSTDGSGSICDDYRAKDRRVKVIHQHNQGVSHARNEAVAMARGTFLQFVDADDRITLDATKLMVRAMKENSCDLVIADFYRVSGERIAHKGDIGTDGVLSRTEFADFMMENPADFYYGVLWNKLFRTEIVRKYRLLMQEDISWCEDFLFNLEYLLHVEKVYALQAPVYYYVKTKGSLVSQGSSISKVIKMKSHVFEYYNEFYKHVYDEKDYEKKRLGVYRFFLESAKDGGVMPSLFPGSRKLGEERISMHLQDTLREDIVINTYINSKILERYMKTIALRYDLGLQEVMVILYIYRGKDAADKKMLADYSGLSGRSVSRILQKLVFRKMIAVTGKGRQAKIRLLEEALPVCQELDKIQDDYDEVRFHGFTEEEKREYKNMSERAACNIQKIWVN